MGRGRRQGRRGEPRVAHRQRHVRGKTVRRRIESRNRPARVPPSRGFDVRGHRVGHGLPRRAQGRGGAQRHAPRASLPRAQRRARPTGRRRHGSLRRRRSRATRRVEARRRPCHRRGRGRAIAGRRGRRDATRCGSVCRHRLCVRAGPREFTRRTVAWANRVRRSGGRHRDGSAVRRSFRRHRRRGRAGRHRDADGHVPRAAYTRGGAVKARGEDSGVVAAVGRRRGRF
mmetsp:Transcript_11959/g.55486  ORF Transcript_11959/g.55486 Transcript_11959/m.55486 type:complete len:229 (+) Transcript_11959:489-1175(+)